MCEPDIVADIDAWLEHNSLVNPYRQMVSRARDEIAALRAERAALRQAVAFFASGIKSGEPWTDVCERAYRAVIDGPPPEPSDNA